MIIDLQTELEQLGKCMQITDENGDIIARGVWISDAITAFHDNGISTVSYPDTGLFLLFKGSQASATVDDKFKQYIDADRKTTRVIIFQSRNAAAEFVRGDKGSTGDWK